MTETREQYMTEEDEARDVWRLPKRLSDALGVDHDDGWRVYVCDLAAEGVEFTVSSIVERMGQFGEFIVVNIEVAGKPGHFLSSHEAILQKLRAVDASDFPLQATICKRVSHSGYSYYDIG